MGAIAMLYAMLHVTTAIRLCAMTVAKSRCCGWLAHAWLPYLPEHVSMAAHVHVLHGCHISQSTCPWQIMFMLYMYITGTTRYLNICGGIMFSTFAVLTSNAAYRVVHHMCRSICRPTHKCSKECSAMCQLHSELARCVQQEELEALFIQLDKAKGRATSSLGKGELGDALKAFFRVGQPGGKSEERHDELMQVGFLVFLDLMFIFPIVVAEIFLNFMLARIVFLLNSVAANKDLLTSRLKCVVRFYVGMPSIFFPLLCPSLLLFFSREPGHVVL